LHIERLDGSKRIRCQEEEREGFRKLIPEEMHAAWQKSDKHSSQFSHDERKHINKRRTRSKTVDLRRRGLGFFLGSCESSSGIMR